LDTPGLAFALGLRFYIRLRTFDYVFVFKQLDGNFFVGVFSMKYRGIECAVIQDVDQGTWRWTVNPIDGTESGLRKTREGALTAVVLTIDRRFARKSFGARRASARWREKGCTETASFISRAAEKAAPSRG
jgi:hypothetical protein